MTQTPDPLLQIDSYGCVFMYATHLDLTTAPRHIIRMTEPICPDKLQAALETALRRFPQMALGLRRGKTQYAYRHLHRPPVVLPFDDRSPYYIGSDDTNGYLFLCGYRERTIYLEYQHCISDGRGFDQFIRCVLYYYLQLCGHPVQNDGSIRTLETAYHPAESEDGYVLLEDAPQSDENYHPHDRAFHAPVPENAQDSDELLTELTLSLSEVKAFCKQHGLSPMTFLMTAISQGMFRTYYQGTNRTEPIVAEIPMDLRGYIPTPTTRFFVSLLDLPFPYEYFSLPFIEACRRLREYFDTQRALPHAAFWALKNARRVSAGHALDIPIAEKEQRMRQQARDYIRRDSFILTNIGTFAPTESMAAYIEDYTAILPCAHQPFGFLVSSYRDRLKLSVAQRDFDAALVPSMQAVLRELGFQTQTCSHTFHVTRYDGTHLAE